MKRILIALALLLPFSAIAQDRYDVPQTGTKVGLTRTGINSNFTFLFIAGTNAFRTAVEKGSNINFVAKSPTNATQLDYCLTNGSGSAGSPQSPLTNDLDAAGNSIENLDAPEITNTTIFIRLWGTNVLSLQGTTNVALNGVSLKDGPSDGNTPQGPWTNVVSLNGFAGTGGDYVQVTNQSAFRVGTNILAVQGWPDATNIAWNGAALINVSGGGGGGGAYAFQGTNNIAPTNANGNTVAVDATASQVMGGQTNVIGGARNSANLGGALNDIGDRSDWSSVVGGYNNNMSTDDDYCFIGGGDLNDIANLVSDSVIVGGNNNNIASYASYSCIGGGDDNNILASTVVATIAGGESGSVAGNYAAIGGGQGNSIGSGATHATVSGGYDNDIAASATFATVGGGQNNDVGDSSLSANIAGGSANSIGASANRSAIGGGSGNVVSNSATYATVAGGQTNRNGSMAAGTIGGGARNVLGAASWTTIAGGDGNYIAYELGAGAYGSSIGGGQFNVIGETANGATIAGGYYCQIRGNSVTAFAAGDSCIISNARGSVALGELAQVIYPHSFVFNDNYTNYFANTGPAQFLVKVAGGVGINTNAPTQSLDVNGQIKISGTASNQYLFPGGAGLWTDGTNLWFRNNTNGSEKITAL